MPSDPVVAASGLLTVQYAVGTQVIENVLGLHVAPDAGFSSQSGYQLLSGWWAAMRGSFPDAVHCTGGILRDIRVAPSIAYDVPAPTQPQGALTGQIAPLQVTRLVRCLTAVGTRRARGRIYLGPVEDNSINSDGKTLTSSDVSGVQSALNSALTYMNQEAAGFQLAVVSRTGGYSTPITSFVVQTGIATQRRRLR